MDEYNLCLNCDKNLSGNFRYCWDCREQLPECICGRKLTDERYGKCYNCFTKNKKKCEKCTKLIDKKYRTCFTCK
jgi:hypothetical protein